MQLGNFELYLTWVLLQLSNICASTENGSAATVSFTCGNGVLIDINSLCDGVNDCGNWDDECTCQDVPESLCRKQPCLSVNTEIRRIQMCDGRFDCPDLSDECLCDRETEENEGTINICNHLLHCDEGKCPIGQVMCSNNSSIDQCIERHQICDGVVDCLDKVDEILCGSSPESKTCSRSIFINSTKACLCDGIIDLPDGEDEKNCRKYFYCTKYSQDVIVPIRSNNSRAKIGGYTNFFIDWRRTFDGVQDCENAMDEWQEKYFYCFKTWNADDRFDCNKSDIDLGRENAKNCTNYRSRRFSSALYMNSSKVGTVLGWTISIIAIAANFVAIRNIAQNWRRKDESRAVPWIKKGNDILVLSLATCDFLIGIFGICFGIKVAVSAGKYWKYDFVWKKKNSCVITVLIILFLSQVSVNTITVLIGMRLYSVLFPFKTVSTNAVIGLVVISWVLPTLPCGLMFLTEELTTLSASIPNLPQVDAVMLDKTQVKTLLRRVHMLHKMDSRENHTAFDTIFDYDRFDGMSWEEMENYLAGLNEKFGNWMFFRPHLHFRSCIPDLIIKVGDPGWEVKTVLVAIVSFSYIFVSTAYLIVLMRTTSVKSIPCLNESSSPSDNETAPTQRQEERIAVQRTDSRTKEDRTIQKYVFWMALVNFITWSPVIITNIISLSSEGIDAESLRSKTMVEIAFHLNSALNPFFYSRVARRRAYSVLILPFKTGFVRVKRFLRARNESA